MKLKQISLILLISNLSLYAQSDLYHFDHQKQSIAIGTNSSASGKHSTAIGCMSNAEGDSSLALGSNAISKGHNSISIGSHTQTADDSSVAIGSGSKSIESGSIAIGSTSESKAENGIAIGYQSKVEANAHGGVAIGITAQAKSEGSVALGDDSQAIENNTISIGNDGLKRKIVNMKAGVADSDGATVGQLNKKADVGMVVKNSIKIFNDEEHIKTNTENIENITNKENNNKENTLHINKNTENIRQNTTNIHNLNNRVDHLDSKLNRGMSLMAAMSAIDFGNSKSGDLLLGAGVGHYINSDAVALGLSYSPNENLRVNGKYSVSTDEPSSSAAGVGMTYRLANFN